VTVVSDSHYQSTLDVVYVYVVPWSEFPIVPSYPHYPQLGLERVHAPPMPALILQGYLDHKKQRPLILTVRLVRPPPQETGDNRGWRCGTPPPHPKP